MKTIKFVASLFYRYYSEGRWSRPNTAFLRTKLSMTLFAWFHLVQFSLLSKLSEIIFYNRLTAIASMITIFLLLSFLLKEKELEQLKEKYDYEWDKVFTANVWLIIYIILSMSLMIMLMVFNKK